MINNKNAKAEASGAKKNEINEIDLLPIFMALLKKVWLIAVAALVVGAGFFTVTQTLITPTYRSSFTAYVNNRSQYYSEDTNRLSSSDIVAAQELVRAYSKILTSRTVLYNAGQAIGYDMPYSALSRMVSTSVENETGIITFYVVSESPEIAYKLAQEIADSAPAQIGEIIEGSSMKIIDNPKVSSSIYKPSYLRNTALGMFIGAALAALYVIIRYLADDKVRSEDELEAKFSIPVVGVIPDLNSNSKHYGYYNYAYGYYKSKDSGGSDGEE